MRPNLFSNGRWYFPYPSSANGQTTAYFMSFADRTNLPFYISNFYSLMKHCAICDPHCCCYDSKWKNQSLVSTYFLDIFGRFSTHFLVVLGDFLVKPGAYFMSTCGCRQKQPSQFPISRGIKNMAMGIKRSCAPCKSNLER